MMEIQKTKNSRPYTEILNKIKSVSLRPTRQRLALGKLLFDEAYRHFTPESLHEEATAAGVKVSLATVYNTLNQFAAAGLLTKVVVAPGRSYYDTNITNHHHFFYEDNGRLEDIPGDAIKLASFPEPPFGTKVKRFNVVVRVEKD